MQTLYWGEAIDIPHLDQLGVTNGLKYRLIEIRDLAKSGLTDIHPLIGKFDCEPDRIRSEHNQLLCAEWVNKVKSLSSTCIGKLVEFASAVIEEAVSICGATPCQFAAIGLGSLARGEATPYSNLESLFLMEDMAHERYFEKLAVTVRFIIGNLGETNLEHMDIEELGHWFHDKSADGFRVGGLGLNTANIPTGNGREDERIKFVTTVDELVAKYKDFFSFSDSESPHIGDISTMLASTVFLYGSLTIANDFQLKISGIKTTMQSHFATKETLRADLAEFRFESSRYMGTQSHLMHQVCVYPSALVSDLKIFYNISPSECWSVIDEMFCKSLLSEPIIKDLLFMIASAIFVKLSNTVETPSKILNRIDAEQDWTKGRMWPILRDLLIMIFAHTFPVQRAVQEEVLEDKHHRVDPIDDNLLAVGLTLCYSKDYLAFLKISDSCTKRLRSSKAWSFMTVYSDRKSVV